MNTGNKQFPLLYKPRPWSSIIVGATSDTRWRGVPERIQCIDRMAVIARQQRERDRKLGR
jgi:hypothetical protein